MNKAHKYLFEDDNEREGEKPVNLKIRLFHVILKDIIFISIVLIHT